MTSRGRGVRHPFQKERRSTHWQGDLGPHLTRPWSCPNNWLHLNHCGGNGEFESVDKEERVTGPEEIRGKQLSGTDLVRAVAKLNLMGEGPLLDLCGNDFGSVLSHRALAKPAICICSVANGAEGQDVPLTCAGAGHL